MRVLLCVLAIVCMAAPVLAQERTITVYGESSKEIVPNEAVVHVVVRAQNRELQSAKREHDSKLEALYKIAGELQIEKKKLKTTHASIQPQYRYTNNERVFEGYEVASHIAVTVSKTEQVGMLVQQLVDKKFDQIGNVQYQVDNDLAYRDAVLIEALDNAKAKAEKLAERAGGSLGQVVEIIQGQAQRSQPQPMVHGRMMAMEAAADMGGGGVAPPEGVVKITGTVTAVYELK